jgi:hypothetical protein
MKRGQQEGEQQQSMYCNEYKGNKLKEIMKEGRLKLEGRKRDIEDTKFTDQTKESLSNRE